MTSTPIPLTVIDLEKLAQSLETQAETIRGQIRSIRKYCDLKKTTANRFAALDMIGHDVAKAANWQINQIDSVISATPNLLGYPRDTIAYHARAAIKARAERDRLARDREIVRLARRGLTNAEIAQQIGISARTVTAAITAAFRTP